MSCSISGAYSPEQNDTLARKLHAEVSGCGFSTEMPLVYAFVQLQTLGIGG